MECEFCQHGFNPNEPRVSIGQHCFHEDCAETYTRLVHEDDEPVECNSGMYGLYADPEWDEYEDEEYFEDDGQPSEYDEWQDVYGGDDWNHGQFDESF